MSDRRKASFRYFTGTGNSKRIIELCAAEFAQRGWETELAAIPGGGPPPENSTAACFVFPVYSLALPRIVRLYLEALPNAVIGVGVSSKPALLLVTGGDPDDCGWSLVEGSRILAGRGYDVSYTDLIQMPNNWGPFMRVPGREEAAAILADGESKASVAVGAFIAGQRYNKPLSLGKFGPLGSRLLKAGFALGVKRLWTRFRTDERCSSCGLCARSCPTGSIRLEGGRPRWTASCEQCMRCFNLCPRRSILQLEAIGKGSTRNRWIEPHFSP